MLPVGSDAEVEEGTSFSRPSTSESMKLRRQRESEKHRQFQEEQQKWRDLYLQKSEPEDPVAEAKRLKQEAQDRLYQEELARLQSEEPLLFTGSPPAQSGSYSRPTSGRSNSGGYNAASSGSNFR